ncbi:MAG: sigma-70 family RNA polymerase sigma factor [Verrucomicrobia bacterium]|nr:sigma-70 family RNA polymerase sigma factor [Verrucomicrobiota bacterium]
MYLGIDMENAPTAKEVLRLPAVSVAPGTDAYRAQPDGYGRLIRYIRQSGASVGRLEHERERRLRQTVARFRQFLSELLGWPQLREQILIEMELRGLPTRRQGVSEVEAIQSLLVEHQKEIALGVLDSFTSHVNISSRQARDILFHLGAEDDIPAGRRRWLLPHELLALFDRLKLHIKRDYRRYKAAQTDLFFSQIRLAYEMAGRMTSGADQFHDAFQEACVALLHAIDKTAAAKARLSTCAQDWLRGAILRFLQEQRAPVHVPVNALPTLRRRELLPQRLPLEVAHEFHALAEDDPFVHPTVPIARREARPLLRQLFACLTEKQRRVIELRYGFGEDGVAHSLNETARIIGISFQEVDRREKRALRRVHDCGSPQVLRELALCFA